MEDYDKNLQSEFTQDDSSRSTDFQEVEVTDFTQLLEKIKQIDSLESLEDIENMLLAAKQDKTQTLNRVRHQNIELKEELNKAKCLILELDQLHDEEMHKLENLRENIQLKQQEVIQEQTQQIEDLEQFELEVSNISKQFVTAPKEYESSHLNEKIDKLEKIVAENKDVLHLEMEMVAEVRNKFEEPIEIESMGLPLEVFDNSIMAITSSVNNLAKSIDQMSKEVEMLHLNIKSRNIKELFFGRN